MAKRPYGKPKKSKEGGMDPNSLMDQVRQMQREMAQRQEALADETISVTAAGGVVVEDYGPPADQVHHHRSEAVDRRRGDAAGYARRSR